MAADETAHESSELLTLLENWKKVAPDRPLSVMACGKGGVGKSTLINRLLRLKRDEKWAEEGRKGMATTKYVRKYEKMTEHGVKLRLFDTPGFDDPKLSNQEIINDIHSNAEGKVDLLLYCISLDGATRVDRGDLKAFKRLTLAFSSDIWKNAVVVLTFANILSEKVSNKMEYDNIISYISEDVRKGLKEAGVSNASLLKLSIVTAAHIDPKLKYEPDTDDWVLRLFIEALKQVNPEALPALLEAGGYGWKEILTGAGLGALVGVLVGGVCGAAIGGPLGAGVGAKAGASIGAASAGVTGAACGSGIGKLIHRLRKEESFFKAKFEEWQSKENSKQKEDSETKG